MRRINRNLLLSGLLLFVIMFGLYFSFLMNGPIYKVHATELDNIAGEELQIKTIRVNGGEYYCTVTFESGRYLHLNPDTNETIVNNISSGADMEYYNGVLKVNVKDNDDFWDYKSYCIEVYALNTEDKKLTLAVDDHIRFNVFDYPKGNLTITTLDGVDESTPVGFNNKFKTNGDVTVKGYASLSVFPNSATYNTEFTTIFEAVNLQVLENASFNCYTYEDADKYATKVTTLTLNTNGNFMVYALQNGHISALKVDEGTITLTKIHKLTLVAKTEHNDRKMLTNVVSVRNAPETPIDGYYATCEDYGDGLRLEIVPSSAVYTVSFNANGGSGTMDDIVGYYSIRTPGCSFTAPEGKIFSHWRIDSPEGEKVSTGQIELTEDITLYAIWRNAVPQSSDIRFGNYFNTFTSVPSKSDYSYNEETGVLTLSNNINCDLTVYPLNKATHLTIVFDGQHEYGKSSNEQNYFVIMHSGDITLTTTGDTPITVYACIRTDSNLTIKGNIHLVPTGLPSTNSGVLWSILDSTSLVRGLVHAGGKLSVLENASITAIDPFIYDRFRSNSSIISAKYFEFDTTGEVEIGTKTKSYGNNNNAAICFFATTNNSTTSYQEIGDRIIIKKCGEDGCLKLYRNNSSDYYFIGTRANADSSSFGKPNASYLHYNVDEENYTTGGVDAKILKIKPCIISFENGGGSGSMPTEYTMVPGDFVLPVCSFEAPNNKSFVGWSVNGGNPLQPDTVYSIENQTESITITAVWASNAEALTGTVNINGVLKYGELLTATLTGGNNTGTLVYKWQRDGIDIEGATTNTYTLTKEDIGKAIKVVVSSTTETGNLSCQASSLVGKADGPVAPTGLTTITCTTDANNDGLILGVTTLMEYKRATAPNYTSVSGTTIENLVSGTYYVRLKETDTHLASQDAIVVVNAFNAPIQYAITVNFGTASLEAAQAGASITIVANAAAEGKEFDKWVSSDVTFKDASSPTTSFEMPDHNITVTATYKDISSATTPEVETPNPKGLSAGAIVAITLASVVVVAAGAFAIIWFVVKKKTWADFVALFKKK